MLAQMSEHRPMMEEAGDIGHMAFGHVRRADSYVLVLLMLLVTIFFVMATPGAGWAGVVATILEGLTLLLTLRVGRAKQRLWRFVLAVVVVTVALAIGAAASGADANVLRFNAVVIALIGPIVVLRGLQRRMTKIDRETIAAALCIYLMIGLFFSSLYAGVAFLDRDAFQGLGSSQDSDLLYFSFVTQATVGYGDITPVSDMARALSVLGGLFGQLYLVTVVAVVVGNLGRTVRTRSSGGTS